MKLRKLFLTLLSLILLDSCASITIPDIEICTIKGQLQYGMICENTLSSKNRELTFDQSIDFLQANEKHGAALCQSSQDWMLLKNTIEFACKAMKKRCTKKIVSDITKTIDELTKDNKL